MDLTVRSLDGYVVVGATGWLDLPAAGDLRTAVLKGAAEQPAALVCDLDGLTAEAAALTVLLAVADDICRWPSCPFVVVARDRRLRDLLERIGLSRRVPVVLSLEDVPAALLGRPQALRATLRLVPSRTAPGRARSFLSECLREWGADVGVDGLDAAALLVGELVTNAVVHAGTPVDLLVSVRAGTLRVAVADGSEWEPVVRQAGEDEESGRGMALVAALTRVWGVLPRRPAGKVVWAVLDGPERATEVAGSR